MTASNEAAGQEAAERKPVKPVKPEKKGRGWFGVLTWPLVKVWLLLHKHWLSYITGHVLRDKNRIYSVKFVWYGDSVYLHPMIWGSLLLALLARQNWVAGHWLLLAWFAALFVCYLAIMYNFNVFRMATLGVGLVALFGLAYIATVEWAWNPLHALATHLASLKPTVTPGFYVVAAYVFLLLIVSEVIWAWLFHRVEIDESYVYEHRFLSSSTREPIFARGLVRETKDLLELLLLGAADIRHRTKNGYKRFKNVPFASLWLGTAIDGLLDYRRPGQIALENKEDADQARLSDAMHELEEEDEGEGDMDDGAIPYDDDDMDDMDPAQ